MNILTCEKIIVHIHFLTSWNFNYNVYPSKEQLHLSNTPGFLHHFQTFKSCDDATNGLRNIRKLRKNEGWNIVDFVETISLNSMNDNFVA